MNKRLIATVIGCACLTDWRRLPKPEPLTTVPEIFVFTTQRGSCNFTYSFSVNINDGVVSHPDLVKFRGLVGKSGAVGASVTVQDKYASGSGRLTRNSGGGNWSGHAGGGRYADIGPRNETTRTRSPGIWLSENAPSHI